MEKFIAGLAVGTALGALWVANSARTRALVRRGQEDIKGKVDAYIDEKLAEGEEQKGEPAKKK